MSDLLLKSIAEVAQNGYENMQCNLVYYTDVNTSFMIIDNQEIWMRKNNLMNDYSEFLYGEERVRDIIHGSLKEKLDRVLSRLNVSENYFQESFEKMISPLKKQSYILCMTKEQLSEENDGRLSMWRGYGDVGGVAFVFNKRVLIETFASIAMEPSKSIFAPGIFLFPVLYGEHEIIENDINLLFEEVIGYSEEYINCFTKDELLNQVIINLCFAMMIQKHSGFMEEREIRFWFSILNPNGLEEGLTKIVIKNQCLGEIHQRVAAINLDKIFQDSEHLAGVSWSTLIDRIIVGPMQREKAEALREILFDKVRAKDADFNIDKIVLSSIPFRKSLR